jgi:hypothetical protein
MNTLASNSKDFDKGLVTELGFSALYDAESYDQASSIGACSKNLARLLKYLQQNKVLHLYVPNGDTLLVSNSGEFEKWASKYFPTSFGYMVKYGS